MYCKNCGGHMDNRASVCPHCGVPQDNLSYGDDSAGLGWGLLGCCIPIAGLILFLVWRDNKPNTAKMAGIGALISVVLYVVFYIILFVVGVSSAIDYAS